MAWEIEKGIDTTIFAQVVFEDRDTCITSWSSFFLLECTRKSFTYKMHARYTSLVIGDKTTIIFYDFKAVALLNAYIRFYKDSE